MKLPGGLIHNIRVRLATRSMFRLGHLTRERGEDGKWRYSLTEEGRRWTEEAEERQREARLIAHEQRKRPRPPANGIEMACREMLNGNWRPR